MPPVEESLTEVLPVVVSPEMRGPLLLWKEIAERRYSCRPGEEGEETFTEYWVSTVTLTRKRSSPPSERWQGNITQVSCNSCSEFGIGILFDASRTFYSFRLEYIEISPLSFQRFILLTFLFCMNL